MTTVPPEHRLDAIYQKMRKYCGAKYFSIFNKNEEDESAEDDIIFLLNEAKQLREENSKLKMALLKNKCDSCGASGYLHGD